jgi:hypothetical protein
MLKTFSVYTIIFKVEAKIIEDSNSIKLKRNQYLKEISSMIEKYLEERDLKFTI